MLVMCWGFLGGLAIGILALFVAKSIWRISDTIQMLGEIEKSIDRMYGSVQFDSSTINEH
jgi:hypothetical protein